MCCFLILSSIYRKHFSIKSNLTIENVYLRPKNRLYKWFFYFLTKFRNGYQKIRLANPNSKQQTVCKNIQNRQYRSIIMEKSGKSQNQLFSLVFQLQLGYFSLFCNMGFSVEYGLKWRIFWCPYHYILRRRKNTHSSVFYITKGHLQCFLEL